MVSTFQLKRSIRLSLTHTCIANHSRGHEPHALIRNPAHFEGLFRRMAGAQDPTLCLPAANHVCRPLSIYAELVEGGRP